MMRRGPNSVAARIFMPEHPMTAAFEGSELAANNNCQ